MKIKAVSGVMLTLLLTSMLTLAFNIQPVRSEPTTIYVFEVVWCGEIFHVSVKSNSSVSDFYFDQQMKEMGFNVSGPDGTIGFCNVTIPNELMYGAIFVIMVDTELVTHFVTVNATHTLLYFTYTHSTHEVRIIWVWELAPRTWTVDDDGPADFHTIQCAINTARPGDTVLVSSGTYYEHVVVDKTVSLVGQNNTTIIDGNRTGTVIVITANNVTLSGFTILNSGDYQNSGIFLDFTSNSEIKGNIIVSNYHGIRLLHSTNNTLTQNVVENSDVDGIVLSSSHNNRIEDNEVTGSGNMGVELNVDSHFNTIRSNNITGNRNGIGIFDSDRNKIYGNIIERNGAGIWFQHSNTNSIEENLIKQNYPVGVWLISSDSNHIYHNDFFENPTQANIDASYGNSWDNGYPSGGNFWNDYTGIDVYSGQYQNETESDGIGDEPYVIDAENEDRYPLMNPHILSAFQVIYSELYELLTNYMELQSSYDSLQLELNNLQWKYNSLEAELNGLQSEYNSLTDELNVTRNVMNILLITTIVLIATTIYFAIRKPKAMPTSISEI